MTLKNWTSSASSSSAVTTLAQVGSGNIAVMIGGVITNYESTSAANVKILVTNSSNVLKGYIYDNSIDPGDSIYIDTRVVLSNQDKIRIQSDLDEVSFIISGDETATTLVDSIRHPHRTTLGYSTTSAVTMTGAMYAHWGTDDQLLYWDSALTFTFTSAGSNADSSNMSASCWQYLYFDDSAIQTAGTNVITSAYILNSLTAPTWSDSKHGRYNGNDLCFGAAYVNSAGSIRKFYHNGGDYIKWDDEEWLVTDGIPSSAWTDATCISPSFGDNMMAELLVHGVYSDLADWFEIRKNGSTSTEGNQIFFINVGAVRPAVGHRVYLDSNGKFEYRYQDANTNKVHIKQEGYYLPGGM